jgi:hypothetical protein
MNESNLERLAKESIVPLAGAVIAGVLWFILERATTNPVFRIVGVLAVLVVSVIVWMYLYRHRTLRLLGISHIYDNYHAGCPSILQVVAHTHTTVDFLGISGRTFFEDTHIEETVRRKMREGVRFRFLILDPRSEHLASKAQDEADTPEAWKADIDASIARLRKLQSEFGADRLTFETYDVPPLWRALFSDETVAYVNYYTRGHGGRDTPLMVIDNRDASLFHPLKSHFEYLWIRSKSAQSESKSA